MADSDPKEMPFLVGSDFCERHNVAWRVELGSQDPDNPLVEGEMPWDDGLAFKHGTVLLDPVDGLWKAWGTAAPTKVLDRRLVYYESEDGVHWRRPMLDLCPLGNHKKTNVLFDFDSGGSSIYASVLVDLDAPGERRYVMYVLRRVNEPSRFNKIHPVKGFRATDGKEVVHGGLFRYISADGIRWAVDVGPVLADTNDRLHPDYTGDGIFVYRQPDGRFVTYHKAVIEGLPGSLIPYELGPGACRVLARRTSPDGIVWDRREFCLLPDWRDPADTQFMELSVTPMAGGYVGIVTVYHAAQGTLTLQFAASRDGRDWWRPDRRPCISPPALGEYGGGMMWGTHHTVEEGNNLHYYYGAIEGLHSDLFSTEEAAFLRRQDAFPARTLWPLHGEVLSRTPSGPCQYGALCRATWRRGRLWGLVVSSGGNEEGTATTQASLCRGQSISINACTYRGGVLHAELVDHGGKAVPGFAREDCDGLSGDSLCAKMHWHGKDACPSNGLRARFILRRSRLYGFGFTTDAS